MVTDFNDSIQYSLWYYFVAIPLLGGNDHVSWNDYADGNMVNNNMNKESIRECGRSRNSKIDKKTYIDAGSQWNDYYDRIF